MFDCYGFLRLGISNSYFGWLVFLSLRIRDSYVKELVILPLGVNFLTFLG